MANFNIVDAEFNSELRKLEVTDPNHADTFNAALGQLIENDIALYNENLKKLTIGNDYRPNLLINGDFQVWQSGTSFTFSATKYTADQWYITGTANTSASVSKVSNGAQIITSTNTMYLSQYIENYAKLIGKTITCSCSVGDVTYTFTGVMSTTNLYVNTPWGVFYTEYSSSNGTFKVAFQINSSTTVIINWVKLEINDHATPFIPRIYGKELALCQWYYQRYYRNTTSSLNRTLNAICYENMTGYCRAYFAIPEMRVAPTVTNHGALQTRLITAGADIGGTSSYTVSNSSPTGIVITNTNSLIVSTSVYRIGTENSSSDNSLYLELDARI